jgi:porin
MSKLPKGREVHCALILLLTAPVLASGQDGVQEGTVTVESQAAGPASSSEAKRDEPQGPGHSAHNRDVYLQSHPETDTLTRDWLGFGRRLRDRGVTSTLNLWVIYQGSVTGGLRTEDEANGLYWFANHFDLERLLGLPGAEAFVLVEGGWNEGINSSVGALMNVNGTAVGDEPIGVTRLWYDQSLFDARLRVRLGKLDMTLDNFECHGRSVAIDAMPYGNSPRTQFLDSGFVNNASVPFPAAALGAIALAEPVERWYVAAAFVDRQSDAFGWSYSDAFDDWMVAVETGVVLPLLSPHLTGSYYVGYWYSTYPDTPDGQGVYLGVAQELYRDPGGGGLGLFARYGWADRNPSGIRHYWSVGGQYRGLVPRRDDDVLALGWAQAFTPAPAFRAPFEGTLELYYRARLTQWLHLSPHVQYIANPGSSEADDAWALGIRVQLTL